jgi:hypothetical protein
MMRLTQLLSDALTPIAIVAVMASELFHSYI